MGEDGALDELAQQRSLLLAAMDMALVWRAKMLSSQNRTEIFAGPKASTRGAVNGKRQYALAPRPQRQAFPEYGATQVARGNSENFSSAIAVQSS